MVSKNDDAISRSAAMNALSRVFGIPLDYDGNCDETCDEAFAAIEALPALDVAPVVHARWNKDDGTCSACHHEACYDEWTEPMWDYDWDENLVQIGEETHIQFIFSPYCPNCGARMDGEAE